jgi:hypothetical protein
LGFANAQAQPSATTLRVACQVGKPPFSDALNRGNASSNACTGLFYDLFVLATGRMGLGADITLVDSAEILPLVAVDEATNTSQYDMVIAAQTISTAGLASDVAFSVAMYETGYRLGLAPSFQVHPAGMEDSVLRTSVWYLLGLVVIFAFVFGLVTLPLELMNPASDLSKLPRWRRPISAIEQALELMLTNATELEYTSQLAKSLKTLVSLAALFLVMIFGAIITAQLTSSSVGGSEPTLSSVAGKKIAHSNPEMHAWLLSAEVNANAVQVSDIETFADAFYRGEHADFAGYLSESDSVTFLHSLHGGEGNGYVVSGAFSHHGSLDIKAFPMSRLLDDDLRTAFDSNLASIRENGERAALVAQDIVGYTPAVPSDLVVPAATSRALIAVASVLFGLYTALGIGVYGWSVWSASSEAKGEQHSAGEKDDAAEMPQRRRENAGREEIRPSAGTTADGDEPLMVWRGRAMYRVDPAVALMLDALAGSQKVANESASRDTPQRSTAPTPAFTEPDGDVPQLGQELELAQSV